MFKLLTDIRQFLGTCSDEYRIIRRRLFKVMGVILACSVFAVALNFLGFKTANAMIGCILPFVALYMFTSPEVIGGVFLAGLITSPRHPITGIKEVTELVGQALAWIVLVTSMFFLIVGTLPLGRNFGAIWVVYLCFGILLLMDVRNIKKTRFAMGLFYAYAVIALIFSLGFMIPASIHIKLYGHDFFNWTRISPVEEMLDRVDQAQQKAEEATIANALKLIEKKLTQGTALTPDQATVVQKAREQRVSQALPSGIKRGWKEVFPAKPATSDNAPAQQRATATSSGKSLTVELQPDQVYDVDDLRQGQSWQYLSFNGTFSHRIDKGNDSACWKVVDNNLPWSASYAGKLQVKAGNTPVKLTVNVVP